MSGSCPGTRIFANVAAKIYYKICLTEVLQGFKLPLHQY